MKASRPARERLDRLLVERGLVESRTRAEALILARRVRVEGIETVKPGSLVDPEVRIELSEPEHPWVSRGGLKLAAALDTFGIDPNGLVCLDVGASTGGFTDVLLTRGAARVYAVDVGYGQLHARLRSDPRVVLRERVNARFLSREEIPEPIELAVSDVSFISVTLILPAIVPLLAHGARVVLLIKPQFESLRGEVGRGGIVRDPEVRERARRRVLAAAESLRLRLLGERESPITGADGNVEFLAGFASENG
ncbi:MAG: TlyA family RNA methyltransferase [Acidobacteria bacterium]|nr:TlyA family RNA methyltransferase [Acidobacteriota bacterium]MCK6684458.1 TlyA family RNA methyltransferase [Thermoanaerobaculia bacterium]